MKQRRYAAIQQASAKITVPWLTVILCLPGSLAPLTLPVAAQAQVEEPAPPPLPEFSDEEGKSPKASEQTLEESEPPTAVPGEEDSAIENQETPDKDSQEQPATGSGEEPSPGAGSEGPVEDEPVSSGEPEVPPTDSEETEKTTESPVPTDVSEEEPNLEAGSCEPPLMDPDETMTRRVDRLLDSKFLEGARVGIVALAYPEGTVLLSKNPHEKFNPASVSKVFTAAAALLALGETRTFTTVVMASGSQECPVLTLRGDGDPGLSDKDIRILADKVLESGIRCVSKVMYDGHPMDSQSLPPIFDHKRSDAGYRSRIGALGISYGAFWVKVTPAANKGAAPKVEVTPPCSAFIIDNRAVTVPVATESGQSLRMSVSGYKGKVILQLTGEVPMTEERGISDSRALPDPNRFTAFYFLDALVHKGAVVKTPEPQACKAAAEGKIVAEVVSAPLSVDVAEMMQWSRNFVAEQLLKLLSWGRCDPMTFACGLKRLRHILPRFGVPPRCVTFQNGSGLYDANFISPALTVRFLVEALNHGGIAKTFLASFARGNETGTLRGRLKKVGVPVLAKTGTLDGVSTLAGYLLRKEGGYVVFAIFINDARTSVWKLKRIQDRIVEQLSLWKPHRPRHSR